jgi:hypothetical protein
VAKRVSLKGKGADLFFGGLSPTESSDAGVVPTEEQIPDPVGSSEHPESTASGVNSRPRRSEQETGIPTSTQVDKPTKPLAGKRISAQVEESTQPLVVKYTTHLRPATIKALKRVAFESERKDYEIVQEALDAYLKRVMR